MKKLAGERSFARIGRTAERQSVGANDPGIDVRSGFTQDAIGEGPRGGLSRLSVQQRESLRRDGGDGSFWTTRIGIRLIEGFKERVTKIAPDEDIQTAPVSVFLARRGRPEVPLSDRSGQFGGKGRKNARPAPSRVERSGDRQQGVSNRLAVEPAAILPPEKAVLGIHLQILLDGSARLAVCCRRDDQAMEPLHTPAVRGEFDAQPVEQFGMGRFRSVDAEIAGGGDDPLVEMELPKPVDEHAGGQRVARRGEPIGERLRPTGMVLAGFDFRDGVGFGRNQDEGKHRRDFRPFSSVFSSLEKEDRHRSPAVGVDSAGGRRRLGDRRSEKGPRGDRFEPGRLVERIESGVQRERRNALILGKGLKNPSNLVGGPIARLFSKRGRRLIVDSGRRAGSEFLSRRRFDSKQLGFQASKAGFVALPARFEFPPLLGGGDRIIVSKSRAAEEGLKTIKVDLADRIEFMIVTAGAADGQTEEDQAGRLGDVVERDLSTQSLIVEIDHIGLATVEAGGDECRGFVRLDFRPGDLKTNEAVVRQVAIERVDDPIAIAPGIGPNLIEFEAVGIGVTRQIEPVLSPAFAVGRVGEQAIDLLFVSVRRFVCQKGVDLLGSRRQTDQVEGEPAQKRGAIGLGSRRQSRLLQFLNDERVDPISRLPGIMHPGNLDASRRLECPMKPILRANRSRLRPVPLGKRSERKSNGKRPGEDDGGPTDLSKFYNHVNTLLFQDRLDHGAARVGQSGLSAFVEEGQPGVIESEKVKNGRVQIVDMNAIDLGAKADGIGGAVGDSALDAAAGKKNGEAVRVVISPFSAFGHRHSAEFAAPNDEGLLQQPATLEVFEKAGDRSIDPAAHRRMIFLDVLMRVPPTDVARIELNESSTALDQSPRQQTAGAELGGRGVVQSVKPLGFASFPREIDRLGRRGLHPIGQFVSLNPRGQFGIFRAAFQMMSVQLADEIERPALLRGGHAGGRLQVENRIAPGPSEGSLIGRRQKTRTVSGRTPFDSAAGIGQNHESRQIFVFGAESVTDPTSQTRLSHQDRTGVHLIDRLRMIDAIGPTRSNDRDIVRAIADSRQEIGDFQAALSMFSEGSFGAEQGVARDVSASGHRSEAFGQRSTREFLKLRFGIERFEVAWPAVHEEINDSFGFRGEVGRFERERAFRLIGPCVSIEKIGDRQSAETSSGGAKERSTTRGDRKMGRRILAGHDSPRPDPRGSAGAGHLSFRHTRNQGRKPDGRRSFSAGEGSPGESVRTIKREDQEGTVRSRTDRSKMVFNAFENVAAQVLGDYQTRRGVSGNLSLSDSDERAMPAEPAPPPIERRSRSDRFLATIDPFAEVVLVSHVNPDPDALASMLGLSALIKARRPGKAVRLTADGMIARAENQAMVAALEIPIEPIERVSLGRGEAVVMVDSQPHTGRRASEAAVPVAVLDHHETGGNLDGVRYLDLRPNLGATSTIVTGYLLEQEVSVCTRLATALLYGIESETLGYPREASPSDDGALIWLFPRADKDLLAKIRHPKLPQSYFTTYQHALNHAYLYRDLVVCWCGRVPQPDIVAELADFFIRFEAVDWALSAGKFENQLKLSLRCARAGDHGGELLREVVDGLGTAGGHDRRAGGSIPLPDDNPATIDRTLLEIRRRMFDRLDIEDREGRRLIEEPCSEAAK